MKKLILILMLLSVILVNPLSAQFGDNGFEGTGDPEISVDIQYDKGLILIDMTMMPNYHITDIKEGFFKVDLEKNDYIKIADVIFPEGVDYHGDTVYQGSFQLKAYIDQLKMIDAPVKLKLTVSYQVCKEKPVEMCFAPAEKVETLDVEKSFTKYTRDKAEKAREKSVKSAVTKSKSAATTAGESKKPVLSPVILITLALLLLALAVFGGLFTPADDEDIKGRLKKVFMILIFVTGAFFFVKYLSIDTAPEKVKLDWIKDLEKGKALAKKENKPMIVDAYADWCVACVKLDNYTFSHPDVANLLKKEYIIVKLDFTRKTPENEKLKDQLEIKGMPTVIFMDPQGNESKRFAGFYDKDQFLDFVESRVGFFDKVSNLLKGELEKKSILLFFLVFGLGFLTSLTPCVYPVIPIVMGYIGTRSGGKKLKGFYLSIFFVLGLATVYSILGVVAGASGSIMGEAFQSPIVVVIIALIFVLMGLSMAGLFEIPVPSSISSKMQTAGNKGEIFGSLIVGGVAGVIAAPCVGPVLIALLTWISQTKNIFLGFILTFIFSLGMGVIFLLVGTFSGLITAMPKGGKWMETVKYFFATILIAGGIYVLNPISPDWLFNLLWAVFLISLTVFVGVLKIMVEGSFKEKLGKLLLIVILLYGAFLFFTSVEKGFFTPENDSKKGIETGWLAEK